MVLGWLGSGPRPARPRSSEAPESHERPTVRARRAPAARRRRSRSGRRLRRCGFTVRPMPKVRVSAPLMPWHLKLEVPVVAPALAETVSVLLVLPFAGGVTGTG